MPFEPCQFKLLEKCSGNVKEDCGDEQMWLYIGNGICNQFFEFSKFTEEIRKNLICMVLRA